MGIAGLIGKAQTVLGAINAEDLGIVLPHEHCIGEGELWFVEPSDPAEKLMVHQKLSLENLWFVRYHPYSNIDSMSCRDEQMAIEETLRYKLAGGSTLVDLTSIGLNRDPLALVRISRATGLNIIMGCGYYVALTQSSPKGYFIGQTQAKEVKFTEETVAEEIVRDIVEGVDNTGIRAGVIGEIGCSWPLQESEKVSLRGAARAQKQTRAGLIIHPGRSPDSPFEAIKILDKAGADISRMAMSHIESRIADHETFVKLAKTGCYLEWDLFGFEGWFQCRFVKSEANPVHADMPSDHERINQIMAIIEEGYLNQVLISHDHLYKIRMCRYGGPGYAHILKNVVPLMRRKGMTEEQIHTILVENPKRLLSFV